MSLFKGLTETIKSHFVKQSSPLEDELISLLNAHEEFLDRIGTKYNIDIMTEWKDFIAEWIFENIG